MSFFVPYFRKFSGIKKFHHFQFDSSAPGKMFFKQHADSPEQTYDHLKLPWGQDSDELPQIVKPRGLSAD